tara:strand:- start:679 stop:858 length:180 start_codon:yes stop_codon:yes gene_type:complete
MGKKKRLKKSVRKKMDLVINRLHDLEGDDRFALMYEFNEWLFNDSDDWEMDSLPYQQVQ